MNTRLFEQVEIVFWDTTIPVLTHIRRLQGKHINRRSPLNARASRQVAWQRVAWQPVAWQLVVWSFIGLVVGIFLGFIGIAVS